ncbi:hypothetical protein [Natribacillus halophilus]|uniref:Uncharacterized protein n=1 Tax=Natribacillus halophilus TaxID=549003 RepID=A0A1G8P2L7_9BACI|nr:hypothetical protein [Natribacillus halophilus]SDI86723.1 hypothetical protein SAMN04488123_107163 [Natribacillus halophilus]
MYLYKNTGDKGTDTIDIRDMTLTLVSLYKPVKLLDHLQKREKHVYSEHEGVYYIEGMDVPIQLLIQDDLPTEENEYLTLLTNELQEKEQLQRALMDYFQDSKKDLYLLMFHAVFHANPELFTEVIQTMQKLDLDPEAQKKIDEVVKEFEWDKKGYKKDLKKGRKKEKKK